MPKPKQDYEITMSQETLEKAQAYLEQLRQDPSVMGGCLQAVLAGRDLKQLSLEEFVEALIHSKQPKAFAEDPSQVSGKWNQTEMNIMGDISFAVGVTVFDNGAHKGQQAHGEPFQGTLLFTPGALMLQHSPDAQEVGLTSNHSTAGFNYEAYAKLYARRLLPQLLQANERAKRSGQKALITVPGMGCGYFSGPFGKDKDAINSHFQHALAETLAEFQDKVGEDLHIDGVIFDSWGNYKEVGQSEREPKPPLNFHVRHSGADGTPSQLSSPGAFEGGKYKDCQLMSIVAWDHVSWPGNDFYDENARVTDDGVKAAATDVTAQLTGIPGSGYQNGKYLPPKGSADWKTLIAEQGLKLEVKGRISVVNTDNLDKKPLAEAASALRASAAAPVVEAETPAAAASTQDEKTQADKNQVDTLIEGNTFNHQMGGTARVELVDHYGTLGLEAGAEVSAIKKNYRKGALKYHPDKNNNDDRGFKAIVESYEFLKEDANDSNVENGIEKIRQELKKLGIKFGTAPPQMNLLSCQDEARLEALAKILQAAGISHTKNGQLIQMDANDAKAGFKLASVLVRAFKDDPALIETFMKQQNLQELERELQRYRGNTERASQIAFKYLHQIYQTDGAQGLLRTLDGPYQDLIPLNAFETAFRQAVDDGAITDEQLTEATLKLASHLKREWGNTAASIADINAASRYGEAWIERMLNHLTSGDAAERQAKEDNVASVANGGKQRIDELVADYKRKYGGGFHPSRLAAMEKYRRACNDYLDNPSPEKLFEIELMKLQSGAVKIYSDYAHGKRHLISNQRSEAIRKELMGIEYPSELRWEAYGGNRGYYDAKLMERIVGMLRMRDTIYIHPRQGGKHDIYYMDGRGQLQCLHVRSERGGTAFISENGREFVEPETEKWLHKKLQENPIVDPEFDAIMVEKNEVNAQDYQIFADNKQAVVHRYHLDGQFRVRFAEQGRLLQANLFFRDGQWQVSLPSTAMPNRFETLPYTEFLEMKGLQSKRPTEGCRQAMEAASGGVGLEAKAPKSKQAEERRQQVDALPAPLIHKLQALRKISDDVFAGVLKDNKGINAESILRVLDLARKSDGLTNSEFEELRGVLEVEGGDVAMVLEAVAQAKAGKNKTVIDRLEELVEKADQVNKLSDDELAAIAEVVKELEANVASNIPDELKGQENRIRQIQIKLHEGRHGERLNEVSESLKLLYGVFYIHQHQEGLYQCTVRMLDQAKAIVNLAFTIAEKYDYDEAVFDEAEVKIKNLIGVQEGLSEAQKLQAIKDGKFIKMSRAEIEEFIRDELPSVARYPKLMEKTLDDIVNMQKMFQDIAQDASLEAFIQMSEYLRSQETEVMNEAYETELFEEIIEAAHEDELEEKKDEFVAYVQEVSKKLPLPWRKLEAVIKKADLKDDLEPADFLPIRDLLIDISERAKVGAYRPSDDQGAIVRLRKVLEASKHAQTFGSINIALTNISTMCYQHEHGEDVAELIVVSLDAYKHIVSLSCYIAEGKGYDEDVFQEAMEYFKALAVGGEQLTGVDEVKAIRDGNFVKMNGDELEKAIEEKYPNLPDDVKEKALKALVQVQSEYKKMVADTSIAQLQDRAEDWSQQLGLESEEVFIEVFAGCVLKNQKKIGEKKTELESHIETLGQQMEAKLKEQQARSGTEQTVPAQNEANADEHALAASVEPIKRSRSIDGVCPVFYTVDNSGAHTAVGDREDAMRVHHDNGKRGKAGYSAELGSTAVREVQGPRHSQEDESALNRYSGPLPDAEAAQQAMKRTIGELARRCQDPKRVKESGSTMASALVHGHNVTHATLGDAVTLVAVVDKDGRVHVKMLGEILEPNDESEKLRVRNAGGLVSAHQRLLDESTLEMIRDPKQQVALLGFIMGPLPDSEKISLLGEFEKATDKAKWLSDVIATNANLRELGGSAVSRALGDTKMTGVSSEAVVGTEDVGAMVRATVGSPNEVLQIHVITGCDGMFDHIPGSKKADKAEQRRLIEAHVTKQLVELHRSGSGAKKATAQEVTAKLTNSSIDAGVQDNVTTAASSYTYEEMGQAYEDQHVFDGHGGVEAPQTSAEEVGDIMQTELGAEARVDLTGHHTLQQAKAKHPGVGGTPKPLVREDAKPTVDELLTTIIKSNVSTDEQKKAVSALAQYDAEAILASNFAMFPVLRLCYHLENDGGRKDELSGIGIALVKKASGDVESLLNELDRKTKAIYANSHKMHMAFVVAIINAMEKGDLNDEQMTYALERFNRINPDLRKLGFTGDQIKAFSEASEREQAKAARLEAEAKRAREEAASQAEVREAAHRAAIQAAVDGLQGLDAIALAEKVFNYEYIEVAKQARLLLEKMDKIELATLDISQVNSLVLWSVNKTKDGNPQNGLTEALVEKIGQNYGGVKEEGSLLYHFKDICMPYRSLGLEHRIDHSYRRAAKLRASLVAKMVEAIESSRLDAGQLREVALVASTRKQMEKMDFSAQGFSEGALKQLASACNNEAQYQAVRAALDGATPDILKAVLEKASVSADRQKRYLEYAAKYYERRDLADAASIDAYFDYYSLFDRTFFSDPANLANIESAKQLAAQVEHGTNGTLASAQVDQSTNGAAAEVQTTPTSNFAAAIAAAAARKKSSGVAGSEQAVGSVTPPHEANNENLGNAQAVSSTQPLPPHYKPPQVNRDPAVPATGRPLVSMLAQQATAARAAQHPVASAPFNRKKNDAELKNAVKVMANAGQDFCKEYENCKLGRFRKDSHGYAASFESTSGDKVHKSEIRCDNKGISLSGINDDSARCTLELMIAAEYAELYKEQSDGFKATHSPEWDPDKSLDDKRALLKDLDPPFIIDVELEPRDDAKQALIERLAKEEYGMTLGRDYDLQHHAGAAPP